MGEIRKTWLLSSIHVDRTQLQYGTKKVWCAQVRAVNHKEVLGRERHSLFQRLIARDAKSEANRSDINGLY